jgi:ectoine hydroxylase-related dioxygenase (phytanoyl-CoA dioxygenase family)
MTASVLTPAQRDELADRGVVTLRGFAPADLARAAGEAVTRALCEGGLWSAGQPGEVWPKGGLNVKRLGVRPAEIEAVFAAAAMVALSSALLDGAAPDRTIWKRPQLLVTLPNAAPWPSPRGWHRDFPHLARPGRFGAQVFVAFDMVAPGGGGAWVVAGSHRLMEAGRALSIGDTHTRLRRLDFIKALYGGVEDLKAHRDSVEGVELELVELSGEPGDVHVMDPRVLHSAAPNRCDRPRIMATDRLVTAEVAAEVMAVV